MDSKRKRRKRRKARLRALVAALMVCAAVAVISYISVSVYYETHFFPHTEILNVDCGNKTAEAVAEKLSDRAGSYLLTIFDRTGEKYLVRGADIDCRFVNADAVEEALSDQVGFTFPAHLKDEKVYELSDEVKYDENALTRLVSGFSFMDPANMIAPSDAALTITDTGYELTPEAPGTTVIAARVQEAVREAVEQQADTLTLSDDCYENPEVTIDSPEISRVTDAMDSYMQSEITYVTDDQEVLKLDAARIASMLVIDGTEVSVDEKKVADFVQEMAYALNTYGRPREFRTSKGDTVTIGGGDYGWVVDKAGEAEELLSDLGNGQPLTREPVYEQTALYRGEDDIGDTYIEIDYTNQHLYYYESGALKADTDIVSGNISKSNGSPDGVFKIVYKESPATLVGEDYESSVTYFMPFAYNVGIHDADWRSAFGGQIYRTSGSHGCINVPKSAAEKLYGIVEKGTPVIAYYRDDVVLTAENARISNAYSYDKEAAEEKAANKAASDAAAAQAAAEQQAALAALLGLTGDVTEQLAE